MFQKIEFWKLWLFPTAVTEDKSIFIYRYCIEFATSMKYSCAIIQPIYLNTYITNQNKNNSVLLYTC